MKGVGVFAAKEVHSSQVVMPMLSDGGSRRLPATRPADGAPELVEASSTCAMVGTLTRSLSLILTDEPERVPPGYHVAWSGALRTPLGQLVATDMLTGAQLLSMQVGRYTRVTIHVDDAELPMAVAVLAEATTPAQTPVARRPQRTPTATKAKIVVPVGTTEIVTARRRWPHGLVFFEDRSLGSPGPEDVGEGGAFVWATDQVIVSTILHEVDGMATARVWTGPGEPIGLRVIHDARLEIVGSISIATSGDRTARRSTAPLPPATYRARIFVDQVPHAENVVLVLQ